METYLNLPHKSLPNDKILGWSKFKAFAEDKIYFAKKLKFLLGRVENMGKGENAGYIPVFSSFPKNVFKKLL